MKNFIKRYSFLFFFGLLSLASVGQSLTQELQAEKAKKELEDKGIAEDEVKAKLKEKGIDLDNLRPEQLPSLEEEIKAVVAEIEQEKSDTSSAVVDATTTLKEGVDSLLEKETKDAVGETAENVIKDMEDGASLEEALANDLTEKLSKKYRAKTDIYGHHIFFDKSIDLYTTTSSSTTPHSYVLDVGDKIAINIFGASQADLLYEIEEDGFIRPSGMYKIYLKGVTIGKAKILLKNRFRQAYMFGDGQFEVSLHTARTIRVNLFGEVNQPGTYTISALNTALNAIIAAGGINSEASIRQIKIINNGKERILDVYDYLGDPKKIYDFYLYDNDIIFIPKWERLVSANGGGFKVNGRFELIDGEELPELIKFAQGLRSRAYTDVVKYLTFEGEERKLYNYSLQELQNLKPDLQDGDVITIKTSNIKYENYVKINGAVRHPGEYEYSEGLRITDLLQLGHMEEETFSDLAYLRRKNNDGTFQLKRVYVQEVLDNPSSKLNFTLQKEDVLTLYGKSAFVDKYNFSIAGAVRVPNEYFYDPDENITVYDAIMMSKGLKANATDFGYIVGRNIANQNERKYTIINIGEIIQNPRSAQNTIINPGDRIVIPSMETYSDEFKVSISGAVRNPGEYVYDSTLSIKDMLIMAGGLKLEAATNKVDVFRLNLDENNPTVTTATSILLNRELEPFNENSPIKIQPYDRIVVRSIPEFEPMKMVTIQGEVRYPGVYAIIEDNENISSLISRAGGITNEAFPEASSFKRNQDNIGFVVTRVDKALQGKKKYDIGIKNGDQINIPKLIDIVKIDRFGTNSSEVYDDRILGGNDTSGTLNLVVNYRNKRANWYINEFAGGFDRNIVSKRKTKVIHPNGQVKRTRNFLLFKVYPKVRRGSEVVLSPNKKYLKRLDDKEREKLGIPKVEKEKMTLTERLLNVQALVTIATSTVTTTVTSLLLIRDLRETE